MKLFDVFLDNLTRNPDKVQIEDYRHTLTTAQLWADSGRVYGYLRQNGFGAEDVIAVDMPRCCEVFATVMGIWRAGAAFVVLGERSDYMETVLEQTRPKLRIDLALYQQIMGCKPLEGYREPSPDNLACIIYSTGSTGIFKGSMHEYGAIEGYTETKCWEKDNDEFIGEVRECMLCGMYTKSLIDYLINALIVWDSYIYITQANECTDASSVFSRISEKEITDIVLPPGFLCDEKIRSCPSLRFVYSSYDLYPYEGGISCAVYNIYGMTESLPLLCTFKMDAEYELAPVGFPGKGVVLRIMDEHGADVPAGTVGELCFLPSYFRGYCARPDLTKQEIQNGWFHTGDMGKWLPDGSILLLGRRIDMLDTEQGLLIPAEIEIEIKKHLDMGKIHIGLFDKRPTPWIVLYYCGNSTYTVSELREKLKKYLPAHMLPTHAVKMEQFPYFPVGKLNRLAFPVPAR